MFQHQYAPSTASTYVSALGYCHRLAGAPGPSKAFWVMEMLKGYKKLGIRIDSRLPITLPILRNIYYRSYAIFESYCLYGSSFQGHVHNCIFCLFAGRGITCCSRSPAVLQVKQVVKLVDPSGATSGLKIKFYDFKHSYIQPQISITLSRRSDICPVQSLLDYLSHRGFSDGPLFQTLDGHAVPRKTFSEFLSLVFRSCGLDSSKYKGHSFRIGLPLSQPAAVFRMHRSARWGVGNPMHFATTFVYPTSLVVINVVKRGGCILDFISRGLCRAVTCPARYS